MQVDLRGRELGLGLGQEQGQGLGQGAGSKGELLGAFSLRKLCCTLHAGQCTLHAAICTLHVALIKVNKQMTKSKGERASGLWGRRCNGDDGKKLRHNCCSKSQDFYWHAAVAAKFQRLLFLFYFLMFLILLHFIIFFIFLLHLGVAGKSFERRYMHLSQAAVHVDTHNNNVKKKVEKNHTHTHQHTNTHAHASERETECCTRLPGPEAGN